MGPDPRLSAFRGQLPATRMGLPLLSCPAAGLLVRRDLWLISLTARNRLGTIGDIPDLRRPGSTNLCVERKSSYADDALTTVCGLLLIATKSAGLRLLD
jgi:hypothetical protein